jgi:hypothetical protein
MARIDFIPERTADGTVILRAVVRGRADRLRELLRRLIPRSA